VTHEVLYTTVLTFENLRLRRELDDRGEEAGSTDSGASFRDRRLRTSVQLLFIRHKVSAEFMVAAIALTYDVMLALLVDLV
jgi:hypothetical protein